MLHIAVVSEGHDWIGYWGKHMKAQGFRTVKEYQKVRISSTPQRYKSHGPTSVKPLFVFAGEPLARLLPDRSEGPVVEELVPDAAAARSPRVQLLPADLLFAGRLQTAQASLGGRAGQTEVDHQACECFISLR